MVATALTRTTIFNYKGNDFSPTLLDKYQARLSLDLIKLTNPKLLRHATPIPHRDRNSLYMRLPVLPVCKG